MRIAKDGTNNEVTFLGKKIYFDGRVNSLKRCIGNLIDNALKYGTNVDVTLNKSIIYHLIKL